MPFIKEMTVKVSSVIENLTKEGLSDGAPERTEISPSGFLKVSGEDFEITWSELTEGGKVVCAVNVEGGEVRVVRRGAAWSDMLFKEGLSHKSLYTVSPYSFDTVVFCRKIRNNLTKDGGRLDILYNMSIGGADKSVRMRIECLPKEGE